MKKLVFFPLLLAGLLSALAAPLSARSNQVSAELQLDLLLKAISFERKLSGLKSTRRIRLGIVYQGHVEDSRQARQAMIQALRSKRDADFLGFSFHISQIDIQNGGLDEALKLEDPDLLYITPLAGVEINKIFLLSRKESIITFSGLPEYVNQGLSLSFEGQEGAGPQLIINLNSTKAEGAHFSSRLLKLAKIID